MRTSRNLLLILCLTAACLCCLLLSNPSYAADWQSQAMIKPRDGAMPLLPFLDYYIDQSRSMDIEEASAPALAGEYKALSLDAIPNVEGITWLRFTIAPLPPEARPGAFLLDMGQSIPGVPALFDPERNELSGALEWQEKTPSQRNILLLPEEGSQAITCYIRIDGVPGPWFAPIIRTPQNAASNLSSLARNAAILALGVVMVICLLRGLGERGQWRIWTALFVAVALAQAILGMPAVSDKFSFTALAAILAPGIALMLLPHVGRHLMQTGRHSRSLDIQLLLLSLPGAAIALWPLVPGWSWLDRWVDVWPICTLLFVPTALGAWIMGLGGAKRFLSACLAPPLFTGFALAGLDFGFPANLLSSGPIWGVALCALLIAATRSPQLQPPTAGNGQTGKHGQQLPPDGSNDTVISLEHPLDDPNLRLLPSKETDEATHDIEPESARLEHFHDTPEEAQSLEERENALRAPLDEVLRQGAALGQCSLPPAVRQYAENMIAAANVMADIMSGERVPTDVDSGPQTAQTGEQFSLQSVLRNVHDSVASFAESSGTALSWYMPPNLGRLYHGNTEELENVLRLLLESSVRASKNGSVQLSARRVPGSDDPGHILFSVTDNGSGVPPRDRSSLAISRAWELIGKRGGYLAMEAGPDGVDIALSMRFPLEEEEEIGKKGGNHVLLASDNAPRRRELARTIEQLPCRVTQVGSAQEVLVCQSIDPAGLLVAHGQLARPSAADTIHKFADLARDAGFAQTFVLAITDNDKQWHLLKPSGFTHAMLEPEDLETLKDTITGLLKSMRQPGQDGEVQQPEIEEEQERHLSESLAVKESGSAQSTASQPSGVNLESGEVGEKLASRPGGTESVPGFSQVEAEDEKSFEGPDWLKPPVLIQNENELMNPPPASARKASPENTLAMPGLTDISTAADMQQERVRKKSAANAGNDAIEFPGTRSPLTGSADASQTGYNSIMEYIVGAETKLDGDMGAHNEKNGPSLATSDETSKTDNRDSKNSPAGKSQDSDSGGDPVVMALIKELDRAMEEASRAYEKRDSQAVALATGRIIKESENVGLRLLARMASCVEMAARENDLNALSDLLPELALAVERNRLALGQNRTGESQP